MGVNKRLQQLMQIFLVMVLLSSSIVSVISHNIEGVSYAFDTCFDDAIVDQNQSRNSGSAIAFTNDEVLFAQCFQPGLQICTSLSLLVRKKGDFAEDARFFCSLRRFLHIEEQYFDFDLGEISEAASWVSCEIPFEVMDVDQSYYLVVGCEGMSQDDESRDRGYVEWFYGVDDPYFRGDPYVTDDNGEWDPLYVGSDLIDFCFRTFGYENTAPSRPVMPDGPTEGYYGHEYAYITECVDAEDNELYYQWSWGDGSVSDWLGPCHSGEVHEAKHTWSVKGSYIIKVKSRDSWGFESGWSDLLTIRMEKRKLSSVLLFWYEALRSGSWDTQLLMRFHEYTV